MERIIDMLEGGPSILKPTLGFKIGRSIPTMRGRQANVEPLVANQLEYLNETLNRRIFPASEEAESLLVQLTKAHLTPKRSKIVNPNDGWVAKNSLIDKINGHSENSGERRIEDVLNSFNDLTDLRYAFDDELASRWSTLDFNVRTVLSYPAIVHFLVARATLYRGILQPTSLLGFITTHDEGAPNIVQFATAGAARDLVANENLRVADINDDSSPILTAILAKRPVLSVDSFAATVRKSITVNLENKQFQKLIDSSGMTNIPSSVMPTLVEYIKTSAIPVTEENSPFMIPMYAAKAATAPQAPESGIINDPFAVTFFGDDTADLNIDTAAVRCAAQLFYVMTLGDELGVFDVVRYLTQDYLFRDGFAIEDPTLRKDLEDYVFSNRFLYHDPRSGTTDKVDATRDQVRRAYYRQVFDMGKAPTLANTPPNTEFRRLWKILMLESTRFLERAQISPNPDNYVSRQNVMQAVEDLQYNLSTTCVGLATVATPMINAELNFVVERILNHPEIKRHLVPTGGSWLKLIERLAAVQGKRIKATAWNNKARIGHALLTSVADYSPAAFEQDEPFSKFISNVDAFITTSSILSEQDDGDRPEEDQVESGGYGVPDFSGLPGMPSGMPGMPDFGNLPGMNAMNGTNSPNGTGDIKQGTSNSNGTGPSSANDDWDF